MKLLQFLFLSLLILSKSLSASIIHVPAEQPTIQAGIGVSLNGDTVLVSPDIYFENINFNGKNIIVASLFLLNQDTTYISQTIIDGNQNGSVVTFTNGENSNAKLIGFSIQNGSGTLIGNGYFGGGIFCQSSSPSIRYNIISNNAADATSLTQPSDGEGGGIYARMGSPIIEKNIISNNNAIGLLEGGPGQFLWGYGGGIYVESISTCTIDSNQISDNFTGGEGGGIYCEGDTVIISYNLVFNNECGSVGGIACEYLDYSLIISNIIKFNPNGGVYIIDCPSSFIINNLISENTFGGGIWSINSTSKMRVSRI